MYSRFTTLKQRELAKQVYPALLDNSCNNVKGQSDIIFIKPLRGCMLKKKHD